MRDVVVFLIFITLLPACFLRPWTGVLVFSWFAYMRTQDLTWGFVKGLPLSQFVAIAMILGWIVNEFRPIVRRDYRILGMIGLVLLVGLSIPANTVRWELQGWRYQDFIKIIFVALLTAALLTSRARARQLMLVISGSFAFYGVKNGIYFLLGQETITGPGGMLLDNNDFAMAMVMNLPFLWYVGNDERTRGERGVMVFWAMRAAFFLTVLTIASTGSRGGFLAMSFVIFMMAMKTKYKVPAVIATLVLGMLGLAFAPQEYKDRLATLRSLEDQSVQQRLLAWRVSFNMITAKPLTGVGFYNTIYEYPRYVQGLELNVQEYKVHVAHNSYLQVCAETGIPTLLLFLTILFGNQWNLRRLQQQARALERPWAVHYATAIQLSMYGYFAGAMFLNRAHFDLVYQLLAISVALPAVVRTEHAQAKRRRWGAQLAKRVEVRAGEGLGGPAFR